jgi:hypothetical protein
LVHHNFVYISASRQLYLTFYYALYWWVLGVGAIYGRVCLQTTDEIIAVILGFRKHGYVSGMQHVKCAENNADLFTIGVQLLDVIEYHVCSITDRRSVVNTG